MTINDITDRYVRIVGVLGAVTGLAVLGVASAQARASSSAVCVSRIPLTISPGFSPTAGSGKLTSGGERGSITCIGKIAGHRVTGPGSVGLDETYTRASCLSHVGTGTVRVTLPTTAGVMRMVGNATSRRTALVLRAEVRFPAGRFSGIGAAIPTQGNCLLTPLRRALITVTGSLAGTRNDS